MNAVLKKAITIAGGHRALARAIGVSHQTFKHWKKIPPLRVLAIEAATGIPREIQRPDIYPPKDRHR